jgi:hypothetical protein
MGRIGQVDDFKAIVLASHIGKAIRDGYMPDFSLDGNVSQ